VDLNDFVKFMVHVFCSKIGVDENSDEAVLKVREAEFHQRDLLSLQQQFYDQNVGAIINFSRTNPYKPMPLTATLQEVINEMAKGLSRIPLVDSDGGVTKLISQSAVISFIAKHADRLGRAGAQSLSDAKLGIRGVLGATPDMRAIDAFAKLAHANISHLALIDASGHLIGNISVKDIKGAQDFSHLLLPINDFVNAVRRENVLQEIHPSIHANSTDTVSRTIVRLATIRIHRIYITSIPDSQRDRVSRYPPAGVVSLRDMLTLFASK